jgi:hypothetical protein
VTIVDELMAEVRQEIRDGADARYLSQVLRQKFERAYEAGRADRELPRGIQFGHGNTQFNSF